MKPRYRVECDYPNSLFKKGGIIELKTIHPYSGMSYILPDMRVVAPEYFDKYPAIFRKMAWWEGRTKGTLLDVDYVRVTNYVGYWRVGDIVKAKFALEDGKPYGYYLTNHFHPVTHVEPTTHEEYEQQKK